MTLKEIAEEILEYKSFIIMTHISPDGDALGSSIGLAIALEKIGKNCLVILDEEIPEMYSFLPKYDSIILNGEQDVNTDEYQALIVLDSGDKSRMAKRNDLFAKFENTFNIDHHHANPSYAKYNFIGNDASSTGEILYELIADLHIPISYEIALSLYVAICTDTGNFKYRNTSSKTHFVVSKLLKYNINTEEIARAVFDLNSIKRLQLMKKSIESLKLYYDGKIAIMNLTEEDFNEVKADYEEAEGLVDLVRNIEDVNIAVFIRYVKENYYRVNLRSNVEVDVSKVAIEFDGGGHKKASGCFLSGDYFTEEKKLVDSLSKLLEEKS